MLRRVAWLAARISASPTSIASWRWSAETPRLPVTPNRLLLVSGVLVAGIGGGIAFTILLGQFDRSFSRVDQLRDIGLPVLGGISILGRPPLQQRMLVVARFSAAVVALVGVYGGLMAYILRAAALI